MTSILLFPILFNILRTAGEMAVVSYFADYHADLLTTVCRYRHNWKLQLVRNEAYASTNGTEAQLRALTTGLQLFFFLKSILARLYLKQIRRISPNLSLH